MTVISEREREYEEFLYCITHDLKSFSRAMRVIPDWIAEDLTAAKIALPDGVGEHMDMLKSYAGGMDRMLESLTTLSRVGRLADPCADHALNDLLDAAWASLTPGSARLSVPQHAFRVHGPKNDLSRLFAALLSNGVDHNSDPSPDIGVTAVRDGDRVQIRVADNGPGIEAQYRQKVFEPLHTLRPKDETGHAGMGLAIARKVVKSLGGEIHIEEPSAGHGCRVVFDLPGAKTAA
ncbi:sensor histidine kinase [Ponticoccus sp. (in: a-proteobacteria)]|uniref:sensor histidine kinase n=1 Tax=Ponticoccus sp. (in: a-proteobacteria) TaxID=1925025 RepID=UPI003AB14E09